MDYQKEKKKKKIRRKGREGSGVGHAWIYGVCVDHAKEVWGLKSRAQNVTLTYRQDSDGAECRDLLTLPSPSSPHQAKPRQSTVPIILHYLVDTISISHEICSLFINIAHVPHAPAPLPISSPYMVLI